MQFVLLIYHGTSPLPGTEAWNALPQDERKRIYADYGEFNRKPGLTPGLPLALPKDAKTVRVGNGGPQVTDGPYIDARSAVGGYGVIEAENLDGALAVAGSIPAARLGGAVEVRPVAKYW